MAEEPESLRQARSFDAFMQARAAFEQNLRQFKITQALFQEAIKGFKAANSEAQQYLTQARHKQPDEQANE